MGKDTLSKDTAKQVRGSATFGGRQSATTGAEERMRRGEGMNPLVDPKGPAHLGPVRRSLPRFEKKGELWVLTCGVPMAEETLLDTTGSMGSNADKALEVLPKAYEMLTMGLSPVLARYDPQIATAIFNDIEDGPNVPVLCRSQFEMGEKIATQMTLLVPGRQGQGNGKEDPQFGLFGAAYLTDAAINRWGLRYYHFTVSDEPVAEEINLWWLRHIFGDDVLERAKENGHDFIGKGLPDTAQAVADLQKRAHAFFLQVGYRHGVAEQWRELYGTDHFVVLPLGSTDYLHYVKAVIIGLTEGVLDLQSAADFLEEHELSMEIAREIVRTVAHIPLAAQTLCPNFSRIPKAGDVFRNKTDLWPIDPNAVPPIESESDFSDSGPNWL